MGKARVNREYVNSRLATVRAALARLHAMRGGAGAQALADPDRFAIAEHHLRRLLESALDVARHILARAGTFKPSSYPELIEGLARLGAIPAALSQRVQELAEERNRLVHLGPEVTPADLWALMAGPIDCLPQFCKDIEEYLATKEP